MFVKPDAVAGSGLSGLLLKVPGFESGEKENSMSGARLAIVCFAGTVGEEDFWNSSAVSWAWAIESNASTMNRPRPFVFIKDSGSICLVRLASGCFLTLRTIKMQNKSGVICLAKHWDRSAAGQKMRPDLF